MPHPYVEYEGTPLWAAVERALRDLVGNSDLTLTTAPEYVIGYLCRAVSPLTDTASVPAGEGPAA